MQYRVLVHKRTVYVVTVTASSYAEARAEAAKVVNGGKAGKPTSPPHLDFPSVDKIE